MLATSRYVGAIDGRWRKFQLLAIGNVSSLELNTGFFSHDGNIDVLAEGALNNETVPYFWVSNAFPHGQGQRNRHSDTIMDIYFWPG